MRNTADMVDSSTHITAVRVSFIEPGGQRRDCRGPVGQNLMDLAIGEGIDGITGQCGGAINCATCLCRLPPYWFERLPQAIPDERELLSYVDEAGPRSRLGCQVILSPDLNGLVVQVTPTLPENTR